MRVTMLTMLGQQIIVIITAILIIIITKIMSILILQVLNMNEKHYKELADIDVNQV